MVYYYLPAHPPAYARPLTIRRFYPQSAFKSLMSLVPLQLQQPLRRCFVYYRCGGGLPLLYTTQLHAIQGGARQQSYLFFVVTVYHKSQICFSEIIYTIS